LLRKEWIVKGIFLTIKPSLFRDRDLEDSLQARKVFLPKEWTLSFVFAIRIPRKS